MPRPCVSPAFCNVRRADARPITLFYAPLRELGRQDVASFTSAPRADQRQIQKRKQATSKTRAELQLHPAGKSMGRTLFWPWHMSRPTLLTAAFQVPLKHKTTSRACVLRLWPLQREGQHFVGLNHSWPNNPLDRSSMGLHVLAANPVKLVTGAFSESSPRTASSVRNLATATAVAELLC